MPTGERPASLRRRPLARGFTYLLLLFGLAIAGVALAALGTQWQVVAQRERETELLFRAIQIRDALQRFHDQTPDGQARLPRTLDELLSDARWPVPRHHLRRLYADPFTRAADWQLLREAGGGIVGLHSRSAQPALRQQALPAGVQLVQANTEHARASPDDSASARPIQVRDWHLVIQHQRVAVRQNP